MDKIFEIRSRCTVVTADLCGSSFILLVPIYLDRFQSHKDPHQTARYPFRISGLHLPDMVGKMFLSREGFSAERAFVRSLSSVQVHVIREMLLAGERLRTERALERCFPGVFPVIVFSTIMSYVGILHRMSIKYVGHACLKLKY